MTDTVPAVHEITTEIDPELLSPKESQLSIALLRALAETGSSNRPTCGAEFNSAF